MQEENESPEMPYHHHIGNLLFSEGLILFSIL